MEILEWNPSLETGVEKIDDQHKVLIERIYKVKEAGKNGSSADELIPTLFFLKRYVAEHFSDEEQLQIQSNYPKYEEHKKAHIVFMEKIEKLFEKCQEEGVNLITILETNKTVYDWLVEHINKLDMEFSEYYRSKYSD